MKFDQLYRCHLCLEGRKTPISKKALALKLECSERTAERYIKQLETHWDAPIRYYPRRGWQYDPEEREKWHVPGLWMTREESQSLLLLLNILNRFGNGLMSEELNGVRSSIDRMLKRRGLNRQKLEDRIRITPIGYRATNYSHLSHVLTALVDRTGIDIRYEDFSSRKTTRTISPQRLVYYRDNWYVHSWCHKAEGLRTFSIARIDWSRISEGKAVEIEDERLDDYFKSSYGMFAGKPEQTARLRFLPPIATEIARQRWHPDQSGRWEKKHYVLTLPYSDATELKQDILKHLPYVVVESPESLRLEIREALLQSLARYPEAVQKYRSGVVEGDR